MNQSLGANVLKLLSSKLAGQAIMFATAPVIARLFLPEYFGIRQIFISIYEMILVVTCLRYEMSIPLGRDKRQASASFLLSLLFTFIFTLLILALVPILKARTAQSFGVTELQAFLWLLPPALLIGGLGNALKYYASREGEFGKIAYSRLSSVLCQIIIILAWALIIDASATVLFAAYFAGISLRVLMLIAFLGNRLLSDLKNAHLTFDMLYTTAKKYRKFPIFDIWSALINSLFIQLPPLILGLKFPSTVVGYYSLGYRLVSFPMATLGHSIAQVFFPNAAKEYSKTRSLSNIVSNVFKRLAQIGVFPMTMLGLFGATLFRLAFGVKWIEAGVYAQILSVWTLFIFITSPLSTVFTILERQATWLIFSLALISAGTLVLLLGTWTQNPRIALTLFAIVSLGGWSLLLCWILRNSKVPLLWAAKTLFKYVVLSCSLLFPAAILAWLGTTVIIVLLGILLAAMIYLFGLYQLDSSIREFAVSIIGRISARTLPQ